MTGLSLNELNTQAQTKAYNQWLTQQKNDEYPWLFRVEEAMDYIAKIAKAELLLKSDATIKVLPSANIVIQDAAFTNQALCLEVKQSKTIIESLYATLAANENNEMKHNFVYHAFKNELAKQIVHTTDAPKNCFTAAVEAANSEIEQDKEEITSFDCFIDVCLDECLEFNAEGILAKNPLAA